MTDPVRAKLSEQAHAVITLIKRGCTPPPEDLMDLARAYLALEARLAAAEGLMKRAADYIEKGYDPHDEGCEPDPDPNMPEEFRACSICGLAKLLAELRAACADELSAILKGEGK